LTEISASILEVNSLRYYDSIKNAVECGIKLFHFDVTDRIYTKRISFGDRLVSSVLNSFDVLGEVHLMVSRPELQAESFVGVEKVKTIYFHPDSSAQPLRLIRELKQKGKKVGIALTLPFKFDPSLIEEADAVLMLLLTSSPP